jgi:hypothetical protein
MQDGDEHEAVRRPVMCVADEGAERDLVDEPGHRAVGPLRRGLVDDEEQRARDRQHEEEDRGRAAQATSHLERKRGGRHEARVEVQDEVGEAGGLPLGREAGALLLAHGGDPRILAHGSEAKSFFPNRTAERARPAASTSGWARDS